MSKVTLANVGSLIDATTAATTINSNSGAIVAAMNSALFRDGSNPNQMESSLDMNSNRILNLPAPVSGGEPARLEDIQNIIVAQLPTAIASNVYDTVASVVLTNISPSVHSIRTAGYASAGDGGGADYYHASGSTAGGFQSADGQWWQLVSIGAPNVRQYGAKGDGVSSDITAFTTALTPWAAAAYQSGLGYDLKIPPGKYILPSTLNIYAPNAENRLTGIGRPILRHTGSGIGFNGDNPVGLGPVGPQIENITFQGNSNTSILLYVNNQCRLDWKNIHLKEASSVGWAFRIDFCILSRFSHITHSQGDTSVPSIGLQVGNGVLSATSVVASIFDNIIMEGVGSGIEVQNASDVVFRGGVCESNTTGIHVAPVCVNITFDTVDCEANTNYDWFIEGSSCNLNNCSAGSTNGLIIGGRNNRITGGYYSNITNSGGAHNIFDGVRFGSGGGTFTPGASDKWRNMYNTLTNTYVADNWT